MKTITSAWWRHASTQQSYLLINNIAAIVIIGSIGFASASPAHAAPVAQDVTPTALPLIATETPVVPVSSAVVAPTIRPTLRPTRLPTRPPAATIPVATATDAGPTAVPLPTSTPLPAISSVTWARPIQLSNPGQYAGAPALAADRSGMVHVLWSERDPNTKLTAEGEAFFYARWDGTRWSAPKDVLTSPDEDGVEAPTMAVSDDGFLHVVWGTGGIDSRLIYARAPACCADKPGNWSKPVVLGLPVNLSTSLAIDHKGVIHVAFAALDGALYYYRSFDGGVTWRTSPPLLGKIRTGGEYPVFPALAVDNAGRVHMAWTIYPWPGSFVLYNRSDDGGDTWGKPQVIDRSDNNLFSSTRDYGPVFINVSTTVDPQGNERVHLIWDGPPTVERNHIYSDDGGKTWSQRYLIFPEITRVGRAGFNHIMIDSAGTYHAVAFNWHSIWRGSSWLPASIRFNDSGSAEQMSALVTMGNQLNVVYQDKTAETIPAVYYVQGLSSAPRLPVQPLAKILPEQLSAQPLPPGQVPTRVPSPAELIPKVKALPTVPVINKEITPDFSSPLDSSLLGVLPIVALLGVVCLVVLGNKRRA